MFQSILLDSTSGTLKEWFQNLWNDTGFVVDYSRFEGYSLGIWGCLIMLVVACFLVYLAVVKKFEPMLLVGIAFGAFLINIPGAYDALMAGPANGQPGGLFWYLYKGVEWVIFPPLIFLGIGAMTDFGPLIANPKSLLLGAAAQVGIFLALLIALLIGFTPQEAGADIVDTALSPLGNGTSQPATEPLVATLQGTPYDTGIDLEVLSEASDYFRKVADRLKADGFLSDKVLKVNIKALMYQVPGGMLSNLINQLKEQNASDKYQEVLEEVPRVRKDLGYPPLVTPTSQIVGTQAVLNVVMGERYKMVTKETKGLLHGEYGTLPAEPDPELYKKVWGDEPRITCRPADLIPPEYEKFKEEVKPYYEQEEDVLSYALFPAGRDEVL